MVPQALHEHEPARAAKDDHRTRSGLDLPSDMMFYLFRHEINSDVRTGNQEMPTATMYILLYPSEKMLQIASHAIDSLAKSNFLLLQGCAMGIVTPPCVSNRWQIVGS